MRWQSRSRLNVLRSREILRVAANVYCIPGLVYTHIVYQHLGRELQILKVDTTEVFRDTKVDDEVLQKKISNCTWQLEMTRTIGSIGIGLADIFTLSLAPTPGARRVHESLPSEIHAIY
jgi:hypothetical protein